ncbi:Transmembrane protein 181 [Acipenser ruthenus]|uniref:Transmembrane protein 181 n=1 Tax=Acipenser ruthenus TaxID=7906 RepID=A0A444UID5_ACIRT|nr:Transmembrane protein 181 [Acipenser ruthenus]
MDSEYPVYEIPLYTELKYFCKKVHEAYKELKEDLTPYRDDRYYRLAPMRLYSLSKRHFVLVFVVFFICFGLTVFIGIAGPKIIDESTLNVSKLISNNTLKTGPFHLKSPPLSTYNQQLWLTCLIQLSQTDGIEFSKEVDMKVEIKGVMNDASVRNIYNSVHNRSRLLHCGATCDEIIVVHLGYLNYTQYQININFTKLQTMKYNINEIIFTWKVYNPSFSQVEIWFRFVFVVFTFMVTGERKCLTFYMPKLFIVGLLWLSAVTLGIWQTVNELHDPTYQFKVDTGNFQGMKVFFLIVVSLYILYLIFLIVRACSELKNTTYIDLRLKFLTALTFVVLIIRSDYEEMPLQNGRAIKASTKYEDETDSD